jgi:hypothetical protein
LDWYAGMSAGNVEEFRAAAQGESAYRPVVERLAAAAMDSIEQAASRSPAITGYRTVTARRSPPGSRRTAISNIWR